jgi:hypothetical protein
MKVFLTKLARRAGFILLLLVAIFAIRLPQSYYLSIPEGSDYKKIPWDFRQLEAGRINENTRLFMGSSLCQASINDSLLDAIDSTDANYLNFGVSHGCNAISTYLLKEVLSTSQKKPGKVFLCLKSDSRPTGIHRMYGAVVDRGEILSTLPLRNIRFGECFFKKFAWNMNFITGCYKLDTRDADQIHYSNYGQVQIEQKEARDISKMYQANLKPMRELIRFMKAAKGRHEPGGVMRSLSDFKMDYLNNMYFQDQKFLESARMLEEQGVAFDVILYPNYTATQMGEEETIAQFYKQLYPEINFDLHHLIALRSEALKNPALWRDLNHLNEEGAALYSTLLRPLLNDYYK